MISEIKENDLPKYLIMLICDSNRIRRIDALPPKLENLMCYCNELTSLPSFPASLHTLDCNRNRIARLPDLRNLKNLNCGSNQLTQLPFLPDTIEHVIAEFNRIHTFPSGGTNLKSIHLYNNSIRELPTIMPSKLELLYIGNNEICDIRNVMFPQTLQELNMGANHIRVLPDNLPDSIETICCDYMKLEELPERMPASLRYINCGGNMLTELPECLRKIMIACESNKLLASRWRYATFSEFIEDLYRLQRLQKKERNVKRTRQYKEELVQTVWHPERLNRMWFSKGLDFEDLVFCDPMIA